MRSRNRKDFEIFGSLYYVTSTIVGFIRVFDDRRICDIFMENLSFYQQRGDFSLIAYVLMPEHFHLILKTNAEHSVSQCIGNFKRITSRQISSFLNSDCQFQLLSNLRIMAALEPASDSRIWKPRFDCFVVIKEATLGQKINYIHNNPVKRGLIENCEDWPYSSARNYARREDTIIPVDVEWKSLGY
jgi:putative transposase